MEHLLDRLQLQCQELEIGERRLKDFFSEIEKYSRAFLDGLESVHMFPEDDSSTGLLAQHPFEERGTSITECLELMRDAIVGTGLNAAAPGHLGYIPGGGLVSSAFGDYLAALTNKYAGMHFASPGAVRIENQCLEWTSKLIGYPDSSLGNLTSGGSIANLIAITTARDQKEVTSQNIKSSVIYYSQQTHHCIQKAIRIAGLNECILRKIDLDDRFRMSPEKLKAQVEEDTSNQLIPFFVAASCGSTDTGAVDEFDRIADICEKHKIWFHIDGAYGGYFAMVEKVKPIFSGIERSDSIVLDPHKTLFLPYGSGIVLVNNGKALFDTFHYTANYLQDAVLSESNVSPADLSPELTKHFRGLRMWLPLLLHGTAPFKAALEEKCILTKYFYEEVIKLGFEVGPPPQLSVCIYRFISKEGDSNEYNLWLMNAIKGEGSTFVSSTTIEGVFWLRIAIVNFRTHKSHVDKFLNLLRKLTSSAGSNSMSRK